MSDISKQIISELRTQIGQDMDINPSAKKVYLSKLDYVLQSPSDQGESTRLREALEELKGIIAIMQDASESSNLRYNAGNMALHKIDQAISSSHREDKGKLTGETFTVKLAPPIEDAGIQKVRDQLTISELKARHGQPVWCQIPSDHPRWGIVDTEKEIVVLGARDLLSFQYYGEWKAFNIPGITEER